MTRLPAGVTIVKPGASGHTGWLVIGNDPAGATIGIWNGRDDARRPVLRLAILWCGNDGQSIKLVTVLASVASANTGEKGHAVRIDFDPHDLIADQCDAVQRIDLPTALSRRDFFAIRV